MPVSSYPHVFPSRHGAEPVEFTSATPADVSAGQCCRPPGFDSHVMRSADAFVVVWLDPLAACGVASSDEACTCCAYAAAVINVNAPAPSAIARRPRIEKVRLLEALDD
jgi:hypothetical protein